jgi:hypothetical protein
MFVQFVPAGLLGHSPIAATAVTLSLSKSQSPFATDLFFFSEVPAVNKP